MPKEMLHNRGERPEDFVTTVGWERDQHVQIGVQVEDPDRTIVDILYGGEGGYLGDVGQSLLQILEGEGWTRPEDLSTAGLGQNAINALNRARAAVERDGLWANLDRQQINTLIQTLRRARDAAFGKDA